MLDMSDAFDSDTTDVVTHERDAEGAYVNGKWVPGATTTTEIAASIQPMSLISREEFRDLPEGTRNEAKAIIWTSYPIKPDDRIIDGDDRYRVLSGDDWQKMGGYSSAILGALS